MRAIDQLSRKAPFGVNAFIYYDELNHCKSKAYAGLPDALRIECHLSVCLAVQCIYLMQLSSQNTT